LRNAFKCFVGKLADSNESKPGSNNHQSNQIPANIRQQLSRPHKFRFSRLNSRRLIKLPAASAAESKFNSSRTIRRKPIKSSANASASAVYSAAATTGASHTGFGMLYLRRKRARSRGQNNNL
jgi:hypothetical protein